VLEAAFSLSIHTNSTLHVAFAIKIPAIIRELELIDISSKTRALEARARESAKALLTEYQIDEASLHINKGVPGEVIAQIANSLGAACTVVGTIGRTGLSGKLLGNSCETSLRYVKGDQLVVSS